MKKIFLPSFIFLTTITNSYANNFENTLSTLPQEITENIYKFLDPESLNNLKQTNKESYNSVINYLNFLNQKENIKISGNIDNLKKWISILTKGKMKSNHNIKRMTIELNETIDFYFNKKTEINEFIKEVYTLFPSLEYLKFSEYQHNYSILIDSIEVKKIDTKFYIKGNISNIFRLLNNFNNYQDNKKISFIHFDLIKNTPYTAEIKSSYQLYLALSSNFHHLKSIVLNDLEDFYFSGGTYFDEISFYELIKQTNASNLYFPLLEEMTIIKNGKEEKFIF
nr:hypothetical protein GTC16762_11670 [Pigmentibacter ruber]